jgi:SAM-dependent methyltransferase
VVQADLHHLPFLSESFDFVYSFGVLHHLPDPERVFRKLLDFLKPGGEIQIYVYWKPETGFVKRFLLGVLSSVRQLTSRLPYRVVWLMSYPVAGIAFICGVFPYKLLRCLPRCRSFAERIPLRQYAMYPFRVCVNDQFDRLSAPIEQRYTRDAVKGWFERAGLRDIGSRENFGWTVTGRKPPGDVCSKSRSFEQNSCALNR